jgi:hypothetical protein
MRPLLFFVLVAMLAIPSPARAGEDDATAQGRAEFLRGTGLARDEKWGEALAAFERSNALKPHAIVMYNMGICERVLGHATRARSRFRASLARADQEPNELPESLREEMRALLDEYERTLPRVTVTLVPADAGVAVDGRPLRELSDGEIPLLEAGVEPPGVGRPPPRGTFQIVLDPGTRVFTLSRKGHADLTTPRSFSSGSRTTLRLELDKLPAILHIDSTEPEAIVRVNGTDVGYAPTDVTRPQGTYRVTVTKAGFVPYVNDVTVAPGDEPVLRASLEREKVALTKRWWFWTVAAGVVAGGALLTFALTRPAPEPPPYDGGSTGWVVVPQPAPSR